MGICGELWNLGIQHPQNASTPWGTLFGCKPRGQPPHYKWEYVETLKIVFVGLQKPTTVPTLWRHTVIPCKTLANPMVSPSPPHGVCVGGWALHWLLHNKRNAFELQRWHHWLKKLRDKSTFYIFMKWSPSTIKVNACWSLFVHFFK